MNEWKRIRHVIIIDNEMKALPYAKINLNDIYCTLYSQFTFWKTIIRMKIWKQKYWTNNDTIILTCNQARPA